MNDLRLSIQDKCFNILEQNIDTDAIVPARYLQTVDTTGLGKYLFIDRQKQSSFPYQPHLYKGEKIMLAGSNFGSGSSREHAVWALTDVGFEAIIAPSYGDIFKTNAFKNSLLVIELKEQECEILSQDRGEVTIDIEAQLVKSQRAQFRFDLDPYHKFCMIHRLDDFAVLENQAETISHFEDQNRVFIKPIDIKPRGSHEGDKYD